MLDQRRAQNKGYITLKEAAKISNYSPDYVGQLIRAGKIKGEQIYSSVAWVTTEDEINAYMDNKNRVASAESVVDFTVFKQMSTYFLYMLIALCAVALLFLQYVLYVSIDVGINKAYLSKAESSNDPQEVIMVSSR